MVNADVTTYSIRKAVDGDLARLYEISHKAISSCYRPILGDESVDFFLDSGAARGYVAGSLSRCSVLIVNNEIIGYSVVKDNLIDLMMIDPNHQRKGWGSILLKNNEEELFKSHSKIRLESFADNCQAVNFYLKNGWEAREKFHDGESGVERLLFIKLIRDNDGFNEVHDN